MREPLARIRFSTPVIEWRGPAPFYFAAVPEEHAGEIRYAARLASYGWGCVPVTCRIGDLEFTTSLIPRAGSYLVPLKAEVRRKSPMVIGDVIILTLEISAAV
jgi:hypothetical protein